MTPTPDIEPIREGLAREICNSVEADNFDELPLNSIHRAAYLQQADACLTYLIKRQAFHSDAYAVIKREMK